MHGISSLSNSSVSGHRVAATIGFPPAALEDTEPQRLHDVNRDLWQRTFQSVMANAHDQSPTLNISFGLHDYSLPTLNSGSPPQPLQAHVFPSPDNPSHYSSASPPELATTGPNFQTSHIQDASPTQVQSPRRFGSRPFSCPDCHTYTTNRKYNMNRHRETRHGKRRNSD
ncbi:hypothetical protein BKA60DRAFT_164329 [Fusarium oxysporum]|nr:hypothetical protein BKA60DRAFT_164329 [Fusarium oxysporum]